VPDISTSSTLTFRKCYFFSSDLLLENFRNVNISTQYNPNKATFNKYMNSVPTVFPPYHLSNTDVGLLLPNACKHCTLSTVTICYWLLFPLQPHLISTGLQLFLHSARYRQSNSVLKYVVTPAARDIIPNRVKENQANDICVLSGFYAPYNGSLYDIFINCNWVVTRWQHTFTHKQYIEQHK